MTELIIMRVAILSFNHVALYELGCASELFALERPDMPSWYDTEIVSFEVDACVLSYGLQLNSQTITSLEAYDLLVIPSWPVNEEANSLLKQQIKSFYRQGKRIISFCSGAFLLAQLGLLNGKPATTHWSYAALFKQRFPQVKYVDDVLYTYDGSIGCSAGSSAAIDLGLEVIRQDFGYQAANKVARRLVLSAHRKGGQSQFAEAPVSRQSTPFSKALDWAMTQICLTDLNVDGFAKKAHMTRRTFDRKFKANMGISAKQWITHQRLNLAKELLENKDYPVDQVAELSGFDNATTMRHHFRKELGISPSFHRTQFQVKQSAH